jgi:hypothetical protein
MTYLSHREHGSTAPRREGLNHDRIEHGRRFVARFLGTRRRAYRAYRHGPRRLEEREIACPASREAGAKTTCDRCVACGGRSAKARADVAILAHGLAWKVKAFATMRAARVASIAP